MISSSVCFKACSLSYLQPVHSMLGLTVDTHRALPTYHNQHKHSILLETRAHLDAPVRPRHEEVAARGQGEHPARVIRLVNGHLHNQQTRHVTSSTSTFNTRKAGKGSDWSIAILHAIVARVCPTHGALHKQRCTYPHPSRHGVVIAITVQIHVFRYFVSQHKKMVCGVWSLYLFFLLVHTRTSHCQLAVFQSLMVPSSEPDASLPSQSVRAFTTSVWSSKDRTTLHVSVFHTFIHSIHCSHPHVRRQ